MVICERLKPYSLVQVGAHELSHKVSVRRRRRRRKTRRSEEKEWGGKRECGFDLHITEAIVVHCRSPHIQQLDDLKKKQYLCHIVRMVAHLQFFSLKFECMPVRLQSQLMFVYWLHCRDPCVSGVSAHGNISSHGLDSGMAGPVSSQPHVFASLCPVLSCRSVCITAVTSLGWVDHLGSLIFIQIVLYATNTQSLSTSVYSLNKGVPLTLISS